MKLGLLLIFILLGNCNYKEVEFHPKAIVIVRAGDVRVGNRSLSLADEVTDKDTIIVGEKSICDLQLLNSDSLAVIRIKEFSRFRLSGKQFGSKKQTHFLIESGNAMFNISKLARNDDIKTVTLVATAGVRGTKYDVAVTANGNTKINVLEGEVAMRVRIPELEKYSSEDQNKSKTLRIVNDALDSKELVVEKGHSSEMLKGAGTKILKETGLSEAIKKNNAEELDKNIDTKALDEKIEKIEDEDLKSSVKEMDDATLHQKLKEYDEMTPIEKEIINDKTKRNAVIQARYQKWEKTWIQRLLEWTKRSFR